MSNSNSQVAHLWANRSKPSARSSNGNFSFTGDLIYSYATPIAKLYPNCALVSSRSYSHTTNGKHLPAIRRALDGKVFYVPFIGTYGGWNRGDQATGHKDNLKHFQDGFASAVKQWRNAKDDWKIKYASELAAGIADSMKDYAGCFKLKAKAWQAPSNEFHATRETVLAFRAEREARFNTPAQVAKRAKDQARRDAKRARALELAHASEVVKAQAWIDGELNQYSTRNGVGTLLRVKGGNLQTSQGATVPLDHAIKAFRFILARKQAAEPWERNGHTLHVGHFQIDSIDAGGNIKAGCHTIMWPEIERVARQLNLMGG